MNVDQAITLVMKHGSAIERSRLAAIMWKELASGETLQVLGALQRPDGGFALWLPQTSNLSDTAYVLQWLDDLGLYRGQCAEQACRYLLDRQQSDGGWDESETILKYNPPEWMTPGREATRVWLTAFCAHVLIRFGYAETAGTHCPTDFLLAHSDETGRLAGYARATWMALPMFSFYPGPTSEAFRRAISAVETDYSSGREGAYLAWMLRCLQDAGLPDEHPLVARALSDLEHSQRPDGAWEPEVGEGEGQAIRATVDALRALQIYGRLATTISRRNSPNMGTL